MLAVTGATGQLGHLVVDALLEKVPAAEIVAIGRNAEKATDLVNRGVTFRQADYDQPATLGPALKDVSKLLLISSSELGQRVQQHEAVIAAAKAAGVELIAYTSILHADTSPIGLAAEHRATEDALSNSGVPFVLLRNGWYSENYAAAVPTALQYGLIGCAGEGRISAAARADFAAAGACVLLEDGQAGRVYELAGDQAFTMSELAAEISKQSGREVTYTNLSQTEHEAALVEAGLPEAIAAMLANADAGIAKGALYDDSHQLSALIGRPTTPIASVVGEALAQLGRSE